MAGYPDIECTPTGCRSFQSERPLKSQVGHEKSCVLVPLTQYRACQFVNDRDVADRIEQLPRVERLDGVLLNQTVVGISTSVLQA